MALTSMSNVYVGNRVNKFFNLNGKVTVNATMLLLENSYTKNVVVKRELQRKLIEVIQVRDYGINKVWIEGSTLAFSRVFAFRGQNKTFGYITDAHAFTFVVHYSFPNK